MLSDTELLLLNSQGFIPGPDESEEGFIERVGKVKESFREEESIPRAHWDWVRMHVKEIFGFEPHSLLAFYSNRSLSPWQGAVTWIENGKIVAVQLRERLRTGSYWGYSRSHVLAHEAIHAARSAFEEPETEEFFAYMVSEKWWQRALGPIVQRPWEVWVFFLFLFLGVFSPWGNGAAAVWLAMGSWRLIKLHSRIRRCAKSLSAALKDPRRVRAVLLRLTDSEIHRFAKGESFLSYAKSQNSLRWRLIRLAYIEAATA